VLVIIPEIDEGLVILFEKIIGIAQVIIEVGQVFPALVSGKFADLQPFFQELTGAVMEPQVVINSAQISIAVDQGSRISLTDLAFTFRAYSLRLMSGVPE